MLGLVAFGSAASPAFAQSALDQQFAEGFSLLRFEPAPAGDRFYSVNDASSTDVPQIVRAMLLGHYTLKPTIVRTDADSGERREIVSSQLYAHLDASVVPLPWLLLNLDAPIALVQEGEGPAAPDSPAFGDLRLGVRARVVGSEHAPFSLAPAVDVWFPTGSEDNLTGDGSFRAQPKLNASGRVGPFIYAANVGYLFREYLDTGSLEIGNTLNFGVGAGFLLVDDRLQVGAELNGGGFVASERDDNLGFLDVAARGALQRQVPRVGRRDRRRYRAGPLRRARHCAARGVQRARTRPRARIGPVKRRRRISARSIATATASTTTPTPARIRRAS